MGVDVLRQVPLPVGQLKLGHENDIRVIEEAELPNGHLVQRFTIRTGDPLGDHQHSGFEWFLIQSGDGVAYLEIDGVVQMMPVEAGSYIYVEPEQWHAFRLRPETVMLACKEQPWADATKCNRVPE